MPQTTKKQLPDLLAASLFALAASIGYFTFELSLFIRQIPDILENVRVTSEKIEPALNEISEIRDLIKPIIVEVNGIREQIPSIVKEVENIRKTIPPILNESAAIRKQLPAALSSVDDASASVVLISAQLNDYQPIVNEALVQVEGARKEIPEIMNRADAMIDRARDAANDASSDVVTNAVGGLLTAPFRLVGNFGSSVLDLTKSEIDNYSKDDIDRLKNMTQEILQKESPSETKTWKNPKTQRRFKITQLKSFNQNNQACRELNIKSWKDSKQTLDKNIITCMNDDGEWENSD